MSRLSVGPSKHQFTGRLLLGVKVVARIRLVEITHFRGIKDLVWLPSPGINCLIGPGDSGKSSILDAIDFCLGARRNIQFNDADFHQLDVETPITISGRRPREARSCLAIDPGRGCEFVEVARKVIFPQCGMEAHAPTRIEQPRGVPEGLNTSPAKP